MTEQNVVSAIRGNGFDATIAKSYVDRLLNLHGDLDTERGKYMAECKIIRGDIKTVLGEAKDAGISSKALRGYIKKELLERKIDAIPDSMDEEAELDYTKLQQVLGQISDLPLGQHALSQVEQPVA